MAYTYTGPNYGKNNFNTTILVPPTTDQALIFPLDHSNKKFDYNFYSPSLTDGRLSNQQVSHFLGEIESTIKSKSFKLKLLKTYATISSIIGFCLFMLYTVVVLADYDDIDYSDYQEHSNKSHGNLRYGRKTQHSYNYEIEEEEVVNVFLGWFLFIFVAMFWAIVIVAYTKYTQKRVRKGVQALIDENQHHYANYGLRWNIPLAFPHWVELWKDYKGQNYSHQVSYQPQVNQVISGQAYRVHQAHVQEQVQEQKYPTLSQAVDQNGYMGFQRNLISRPLLSNQGSGQESANYTPPYPMMFANNDN